MIDLRHLHRPLFLPYDVVAFELMDRGLWSCSLTFSAARPEDVDARLILRPRDQVETERAVVRNEALRNQVKARRPVDLKLAHLAGRLVPSGQEKPRIVADVVVVMQGADGDTREGGYRADGLGVHAATIDPDAT